MNKGLFANAYQPRQDTNKREPTRIVLDESDYRC